MAGTEIRELRADDHVGGFSLGDPQFTPLKTFLQRHAKTFAEHLLSRTYVFVREKRAPVMFLDLRGNVKPIPP